MGEVKPHKRVNDILLGPLERPALRWLAAHQPGWMTPDGLTIIGVAGAFITMLGYGLSHLDRNFLWIACLGFVINWYGDSLDGTLARHRHIERPRYGFFIDHTMDAVTQIMIFFGLGLSPYIDLRIALVCLIAYMLLSVLVYVRTYVVGQFQLSYSKLGPTEVRVLAILLSIFMYFGGTQPDNLTWKIMGKYVITIYDCFVLFVAALLGIFFFTSWLAQMHDLAKVDPAHKQAVEIEHEPLKAAD